MRKVQFPPQVLRMIACFCVSSIMSSDFDIQIIFAIPPIFHFRRWLGNSFPSSRTQNLYHPINQSIKKSKNFIWIFTTFPKYQYCSSFHCFVSLILFGSELCQPQYTEKNQGCIGNAIILWNIKGVCHIVANIQAF